MSDFKSADSWHKQAVTAYLEAALWSTTHFGDDEGCASPGGLSEGDALDSAFSASNLPESIADEALQHLTEFERVCSEAGISLTAFDAGQVGHDFWLSRNGHGSGFFDRGDDVYVCTLRNVLSTDGGETFDVDSTITCDVWERNDSAESEDNGDARRYRGKFDVCDVLQELARQENEVNLVVWCKEGCDSDDVSWDFN